MIVVDTSVLVYAVGDEHRLREPSRRLVEAIGAGRLDARTTPEAIQEFVHVYARRRPRSAAAALGRRCAHLLAPLLVTTEDELARGLRLYERHARLGAFDALLAATAMANGAEAFVAADRAFAEVRGLRFVELGSRPFERLLGT
ncbi:MAG: type II toxin-antitoxin system VapC family toxin [Gaiellaceae bacterium]